MKNKVEHGLINYFVVIFLSFTAASVAWSDQFSVGTASIYNCVTDYVVESDGSLNKNVPDYFSSPTLSLTNGRPECVMLTMKDGSNLTAKAFERVNDHNYGVGISYQTTNKFIDVYASGKVLFGLIEGGRYRKTIKMYCDGIRRVGYLK